MKKLLPDSLAGRTILVLLAGFMISHLAATAMYFSEGREAVSFLDDRRVAERMAVIARLVKRAQPAERRLVLAAVSSPSVRVTLGRTGAVSNGEGSFRSRVLEQLVKFHLGDKWAGRVRVSHTDAAERNRPTPRWSTGMREMGMSPGMRRRMERMMGSGADMRPWMWRMMGGRWSMRRRMERMMGGAAPTGTIQASVQLSRISWLNFSVPLQAPEVFSSNRFLFSVTGMLLVIIGLSVWAIRRSLAPLAIFARAADRFGVDIEATPLPETGPREVRQGAQAFNQMQGRIRRFVEDRTQMVAAIAHDLGTPITRLRLRAEYVKNDTQQRKMLADLDEMERMISSTLSFARDDASSEQRQTFDLVSLLRSVCDGVGDAGYSVSLGSEGRLAFDGRPVALSRALANLIENAVKFGKRARVTHISEPTAVRIRIDDDGPGVPEAQQEEVFNPFHRLDDSRNRDTGGTGLGLTVARSIVRAQGGDITLQNRAAGGLRVEVVLPR